MIKDTELRALLNMLGKTDIFKKGMLYKFDDVPASDIEKIVKETFKHIVTYNSAFNLEVIESTNDSLRRIMKK